MATAGWCRACGQYVYVTESWGCPAGHPASDVSNWYDPDTGQPVVPEWAKGPAQAAGEASAVTDSTSATGSPEAVAAPPAQEAAGAAYAPGSRDALLSELMSAFSGHGGYVATYGNGADLSLSNQVADASWGTGKKKVTYEAVMKAVEPERTLYFWEVLKESGGGLSFGGMDFESSSTMGTKRWGTTKEVVIGPQGKALDYSWDYGATRAKVTEIAERHGWRVKTVLSKKKAMW